MQIWVVDKKNDCGLAQSEVLGQPYRDFGLKVNAGSFDCIQRDAEDCWAEQGFRKTEEEGALKILWVGKEGLRLFWSIFF